MVKYKYCVCGTFYQFILCNLLINFSFETKQIELSQ